MINEKILSKLTTVNVWVFDLDDTLYPRESGLWAQIDKRISAYVKKQLELDDDEEVKRFRQYFRKNYGGALRGLIEEYFVDVKDYLQDVHNIDYSPLKKIRSLPKILKACPAANSFSQMVTVLTLAVSWHIVDWKTVLMAFMMSHSPIFCPSLTGKPITDF